jgi:hypothetical protein
VSPNGSDSAAWTLVPRNRIERVVLINRAQDWAVRKLREILPRVRDDQLRANLSAMLASHQGDIARVLMAVEIRVILAIDAFC